MTRSTIGTLFAGAMMLSAVAPALAGDAAGGKYEAYVRAEKQSQDGTTTTQRSQFARVGATDGSSSVSVHGPQADQHKRGR